MSYRSAAGTGRESSSRYDCTLIPEDRGLGGSVDSRWEDASSVMGGALLFPGMTFSGYDA